MLRFLEPHGFGLNTVVQLSKIDDSVVSESLIFDMVPDAFIRVEFRGIGGKPLELNGVAVLSNVAQDLG